MRPPCTEVDPEIFFDKDRWGEARKTCARCPLATKQACLELTAWEEYGYSGGMTPKQRAAWRWEQRNGKEAEKPEKLAEPRCRCGGLLPGPAGAGRPRLYCSKTCMQRAYEARKAKGIPSPNYRPPITPETEKQIVALWHQGYSIKQTAEEVGVHKSTAQRVFAENGLTRTPEEQKAMSKAAQRAYHADARRMVEKLLQEGAGHSTAEVAALAGCSTSTVNRIRKGMS
ncbi:helix-turn-helix domain-containing protein [Streptomyces griseus]|uniref:helix-turn-helix domain-containing protein n=1 Tax=Streptomyces griseus TaxID=1911 RepID=UPI0033D1060D